MIDVKEKQECCGCGACANVCPVHCITMTEDAEGFLYPETDASRCVGCGLCSTVCVCQREEPLRQKEPVCYAAIIEDDAVCAASSSGGVFSLLAGHMLALDGVVYGVAMSEDVRSCAHIRIAHADELQKLRGSKYLQADAGETYRLVQTDLEKGKPVLFSGVPCQIDALKLFLNRDYANLYCAEVICHGTPSPLLWRTYAEYLEQKHHGTIRSVQFRSKKSGWIEYGLAIDGTNFHQNKTLSEDPYLMMFSRNVCLRPSCYHCRAKELESSADLTLGDFWGIWKAAPELHHDKGVSLVMIQSEKGAGLFASIKGLAVCREMPFEIAVASNTSYSRSVGYPPERDAFFTDLHSISFDEMIRKYCALSVKAKIKKTVLYKAIRKMIP